MGEPTFNGNILEHAKNLKHLTKAFGISTEVIHPVISTMMPKNNKHLESFIIHWCNVIKNLIYNGEAGFQISINSTDEHQRNIMFNNSSLPLEEISKIMNKMDIPVGRKYTLNFAIHDDTIIDGNYLASLFNPAFFMCKITPIHYTTSSINSNQLLGNGYISYTPYEKHEENLKSAGFDVLVFIPSYDEDVGMITCGNAVLSGRLPLNRVN